MSDPRASSAVNAAVFRGELPPVSSLRCVDCGSPATAYDHFKGYDRRHWLDVEPVCDGCHAKRTTTRSSPAGEHTAILLRLTTELVTAIDAEAEAESRSRNAQIAWILRARYRERGIDIKEDLLPYIFDADEATRGEWRNDS